MRVTTFSLVLALLFLSSAVGIAAEPAPAPEKKYGSEIGDFIKPMKLKFAESDKVLDTESLKERTILMMVSSVCTACRAELNEMTMNLKEFKGLSDVYAVIIDIDPTSAIPRFKENAPDIPLLTDSEYTLGGRVHLVSAPATVILEPDGKILYKKAGYEPGQWKEYARTVIKK